MDAIFIITKMLHRWSDAVSAGSRLAVAQWYDSDLQWFRNT